VPLPSLVTQMLTLQTARILASLFLGTAKVGPVRFHPTSCECDTMLHLILRPIVAPLGTQRSTAHMIR